MVVDRSQLEELHGQVLNAWREAVTASTGLPVADRIVIALQLEKRASALANHERLAGASELVTEADLFATGVKQQSPLTKVTAGYALVSAILGAVGLTLFGLIREAWDPTSDAIGAGANTTATAVTGLFTLAASSGLLYVVTQGIARMLQSAAAALDDITTRQHPSAVLLAEVQPNEAKLFGLLGSTVPSVPISAGPIILLGIASLVLGAVIAALAGVGIATQ